MTMSNGSPVGGTTGGGGKRGPRSPNFPAISLPDAIEKTRTVFEKDKRAAVSLNTVLAHLGFSAKLSGSTARVISALRQFGLLDVLGTQFKVSELAYRILALSDGAAERLKAIQEAVKRPAIYREVLNNYPDGLPSDAGLSDYLLIEKKFNQVSIDGFIRAFRASIEFARLIPGAYTDGENVQGAVPLNETGMLSASLPDSTSAQKAPPVGVTREVSSLEEGEAMLQWPSSISATSVADLEDWLKLVVRKLKRRSGIEAATSMPVGDGEDQK
jgi:hypothetical protein